MRRSIGAEHLLHALHQAIVPPTRPNLVVLAWRWRYELALLTGLPLTLVALIQTLGPNGTMLAVTAITTLLIGWPTTRRHLVARAWCTLTPHRLRAGCAQARIHTRHGRLPAILWCSPKVYGEKVLIWCPAGITPHDFVTARHILATACYASSIEIRAHPRYQHLVILGVIRYQPLEPETQVPLKSAYAHKRPRNMPRSGAFCRKIRLVGKAGTVGVAAGAGTARARGAS